MKLNKPNADLYIPDSTEESAALARTTHLALTAHQDDIEILAYHGIAECFGIKDKWLTGVVVTNGSGSPRAGIYEQYTNDEMMDVRRLEQQKAAFVGEYTAQLQLDYSSSEVKDPTNNSSTEDLIEIIEACKPEIVYVHNLADKHDTHVGVTAKAIQAMRQANHKPMQVLGVEVWRDLDWLVDDDKVVLPAGSRPNIAAALIGIFDSQVTGGKRYDLAIAGRRLANATFHTAHETDNEDALTWAMDLTPLIEDPNKSPVDYTLAYIDRLRDDVKTRIEAMF